MNHASMKQFLLHTFFFLFTLQAHAQTKIVGNVTDTKGETLIGVNISLVGTYDGATSKANGDYSFTAYASDSATIKATYTGYTAQEKRIKLTGNELTVNFILKEKISDLKAVVISAGSFEASDEKKGTVLKVLLDSSRNISFVYHEKKKIENSTIIEIIKEGLINELNSSEDLDNLKKINDRTTFYD